MGKNNSNDLFLGTDQILGNVIGAVDKLNQSFSDLDLKMNSSKGFEVFKKGVQEASMLMDQMSNQLSKNFEPMVKEPNISNLIKAFDDTADQINNKFEKLKLPNIGQILLGDKSIFSKVSAQINGVTGSVNTMTNNFGEKQKKMIAGMSDWKNNIKNFSENAQYQMKLFSMGMFREGAPFEKVGTAFTNFTGKAKLGFLDMKDGIASFGTNAQYQTKLFTMSIRDSHPVIADLITKVSDVPGKVSSGFSKATSTISGFGQNAQYQTKLFTMSIRDSHPVIADLITKVSDVPGKVSSGFSKATSTISGFGQKILETIPVSKILNGTLSGIGTGIQKSAGVGTTALTSMVQGLTSVMGFALKALGPAAILGVALVGFGMLDSQMGGQISKMIETVTTKGPEMIKGFVSGILAKLPELMNSGAQIVSGLALAISENLPVIMQSAMALLNGLIDGVVVNLPTLIPAALMIIESLATSLLELAPQLLLTGLNLLISLIDGILANQGQLVATVTTIIESFTKNITDNLPQILDKGIEILVKLAEGIASVLPQLIPVALKAITTLVNTLSENLPKLLNAAVEIVGKLCEGLLANLPQILSAAVELILALVMGIGNSIPKVIQAGAEILLKFIETFGKAIPDLKDAGMNLMKGLIDGIGGMVNTVIETVKNIGKSIGDTFKNIFKIHSPSRWMRDEIGAMLPAGLAIGIERNAYVVDQAMDDLASDIMLPSLDSLNQQVDTVQKLSVHSSSIQTQQKEKQPATFNIKLGNQNFKAFVSDISEAMGQDAAINLAF